MEVMAYFEKMARKELLKTGRWLRVWDKVRGYDYDDTGISLHYERSAEPVFLPYDMFPFSREQLETFHRVGYITTLRSSRKPVKKPVYIIQVQNYTEQMTIETIHAHVYDRIYRQYKARTYIPGEMVQFQDHRISLEGGYCAIGLRVERREFPNIVAYSNCADQVTVGAYKM